MNWLNQLERKYGRYAVMNLMYYIVAANGAAFVLNLFAGGRLYYTLSLNPHLVLQGQVWRLITFIAVPPANNVLFLIIALYFYYMIGTNLEREWGSFKFNLFYLCGAVVTIIASFITGATAPAYYLNLSLFLAFAYIYPNVEIMLYFILPVKVKYLGYLSCLYLLFVIVTSPLSHKIFALVPIVSFLIFFGNGLLSNLKLRRQVYENRKRFFSEVKKARRPEDNDE